MDLRVRQTVAALISIARHLAGYPGRKNLLWISSSFPISLNADGSDNNFPPGGPVNDEISCLALQPDGKLLMGGYFTSVDSISRIGIVRLNFQTNNDNAFIFSKNKYSEKEETGFADIKIRRTGSSASNRYGSGRE